MKKRIIAPNNLPLILTPDASGRMSKELEKNSQQMKEIADLLKKTFGDTSVQRRTIIVSDGESPYT